VIPSVENQVKRSENDAVPGKLDAFILNILKNILNRLGLQSDDRKITLACVVAIATMIFLMLIPFVDKAFHIDDPLFIWTAKHILHAPLDFYGFNVNWYGIEEPMVDVTKNPPMVSYYLALIGLLFGWGEVVIHLAMIVPAIFAGLGIFFLARRFCASPLEATIISLLTPAFMVSATTVMCDITMLAFWIWAIYLWITGLDENKNIHLAFSALLISAAALSKYYGVALIPLLFAYTLIKMNKIDGRVFYLFIPVLILVSYEGFTHILYGKGMLSDASNYPIPGRHQEYTTPVRGIIGLNFLGGCLAGSLLFIPFLWRRGSVLWGSALFFIIFIVLSRCATIGGYPIHADAGHRWSIIFQFSLFLFAGLNILALVAVDLCIRRDAASALLAMWVIGTIVFTCYVNWVINARSILPLIPAVGILIARRLEVKNKVQGGRLNHAWVLIPIALLALVVTLADYSLAACGRQIAVLTEEKFRGKQEKIWYVGKWGFRYYMESVGAQSLKPDMSHNAGDILVVPENVSQYIRFNALKYDANKTFDVQPFPWLTTLHKQCAAGYYADPIGPLPFACGNIPPERYYVWKFRDSSVLGKNCK
jgi:hypothetical protein